MHPSRHSIFPTRAGGVPLGMGKLPRDREFIRGPPPEYVGQQDFSGRFLLALSLRPLLSTRAEVVGGTS
jgi:hypothetical protein